MRLENWSITCSQDPYTPPELQSRRLRGEVYGHPDLPDGNRIHTSTIVDVNDGVVVTRNSVYTLGKPNPEYVEWCRENGHHVPTPEQPLKVR